MKQHARRYLRPLRSVLGREGIAGCVLLAVAAVIYVSIIAPREARRNALVSEAQGLQSRYRMLGNTTAGKPGLDEQLRTFHDFFPPVRAASESMGRVFSAAREEGLTLSRGEYRVVREREARLVRYQLTLPVKGTYLQVRRFVALVLAQLPGSALDDIAMKRETVNEQNVDARVRLTLFLGAGS